MAAVDRDRFALFGGSNLGATFAADLWLFDSVEGRWALQVVGAQGEGGGGGGTETVPPGLTGHSLTLAGDGFLYLFGGSYSSGFFSSEMYRVAVGVGQTSQWEKVDQFGEFLALEGIAEIIETVSTYTTTHFMLQERIVPTCE